MKTIKAALLVIALAILMVPGGYALMHPELTQTQLFIKFWWVGIIGATFGSFALVDYK